MADIFEALSQIRGASGSSTTAVADAPEDAPSSAQSGDIFSALADVRAKTKPPEGRPPDEINPPIPPTTFTKEMIKNTPSALAQGAIDVGKKVVGTAGGHILDALDSIRQPGAATAAIKALPETGLQIAKDVGGVAAKAGAGLAKGVTLGAVDLEAGKVGIPFTSIKKQIAVPLGTMLEALGVSPEIANNPHIGAGPEFAGSAAPWGGISRAVGLLGKAAKTATAGTEIAKAAAPMAATAEEAVAKLLGGSIKEKLTQAAGRITQQGITGAIFGLGKVRGPDEDPMVNALSAAKWGAGGSLGLEVVGGVAGVLKAKQLIGLKDDIAKYLYDSQAVADEAAANHQASRIVIKRLYQKGGIDNISHSELADARGAVDDALSKFKAENPKPATETPVETAPPATAPTEPVPPTTDIVPIVTPEVVPPEEVPMHFKSGKPDFVPATLETMVKDYPGVLYENPTVVASKLTAINGVETTPEQVRAQQLLMQKSATEPHIIDALDQIRQAPVPEATPPIPETPPGGASQVQALEPPPPQKGSIEIPKELPTVKPGSTEGEPHALFAYNQKTGEGLAEPFFNIFGDKGKISEISGGKTGWGSSVTLETLQKNNIPIVGREPRAEGMIPGEMNAAAEKAYQQPNFRPESVETAISGGGTATGPVPQAIEQGHLAPEGTGPENQGLQGNAFSPPKVPFPESIVQHPTFIKITNDALSVVNRYAKERGLTTLPENYGKTLFHELHDEFGRIRTAPAATRAAIYKEVSSKYPNIEVEFPMLLKKLQMDKDPEVAEFYAQKAAAESSGSTPSGHALAPMPSEPGPAAPKPTGQPAQPEFPATVPPKEPGPPEATPEAPIFELPEMVQLSKELMEGKFPQVVKRIRAAGGNALGVFYPGKGMIQIRADQFKNPEDAAHTLSHEIGHLADWLPEKDIMRGNIIGRIASLQKYMKDKFIGESFEKHLYNNKKFRNELIALTTKWHPFDPTQASKKYLAYRFSAPELYAEAWSALLNNPKFVKDIAPEFYKGFFDYLDRKPDVKALYEDLGDVIRQGKTAETRHERETAAYAKGDLAAKLKNEAMGHPLRTIWDEMRESLVDTNAKIISSVAKARKAGLDIPAEENPMHALEELRYSSAELSDYAREQADIYHRLKDAGIEWNDMGAYLKADRVINERSQMANPGGQTPKAAKEEIALLYKKYGQENFEKLKTAADEMRGPHREYLISELEKANLVSPELLKKIKENKAYAPFDIIIEERDKSLGGSSSNVGPQIFSQIGTLRDVKNPATTLVMKDLALLRAIRIQQAKLKQANWMLTHEPSWIAEAETKWNGVAHVPVEPADRENTGLMAFYEGGKIRAYYVPRTIADTFRYDPTQASLMMDAWERMNSFFKQVFTAANPGFQVMNIPRDMSSLVMNLRGMSYSKAIKYYVKVAGASKRFAKSEHDPLIQEMLRRKVLITPQNRWSSVAHDVEMESVINRFSDKENEYEHWYSKVLGPLLDRVKMLGQMGEAISKVAGFQYLKDNQLKFGLSDQDINHLVRFQAGSPPFLISGKQSRSISRLLLFFNPHVQGYRRSFEAARLNPGEYTAKTIKYVFLPKLLQYLAWAGVFGASTRQIYRKFSSYNHANYHVIPLGEGPNGHAIGLKIPMDDTERFYGGMFWYALTSQPVGKIMAMMGYPVPEGDFGQDFTKLFSYTAGQAPNLTPGVGALSDLVQYASGKIPYDSFRGKPGIPQNVFDAGGMRSHEAFLKYELNQMGAGLIYRFNTGDLQKVKSDLEKVLGAPVIGNVLSRFLMSTNYGESELIANRVAMAKQEDARGHLDYREAIVQNIMAHEKPASMDEITTLYGDMAKAGLLGDALHLKEWGAFLGFYQRLQSQRLDDPYANGLLFAKSDAEKGAVLDVAKENLSEEEYNKLIGYSVTQKFIHAKTLVSNEFKKASKK